VTSEAAAPNVRRRKICNLLITLAAIHFVLFVGSIVALGGDALTGKVEGERYFLGNHGQFIETSRTIFWFSAIVGRTLVYGTFPLGVLAALLRPRNESRRERPRFWWKG
jgi:hypothetical protein